MVKSLSNTSRHPLGLISLVCLVIGNMIGSGVYLSSFYSLDSLRDAKYVLWIWLIAGVHAICGAVAYAAVAKRLPISGGEYAILSRWGHPVFGFMAGWISIVAGFAAPIALAAGVFAEYATLEFTNNEIGSSIPFWLSVGSIVAAAVLHAIGVSVNAWVNNIVVTIKMLCLAVFLVIGLVWLTNHRESGVLLDAPKEVVAEIQGETQTEEAKPVSRPVGSALIWAMMGSLYFTTLAYTGFNASIYLAGEFSKSNEEAENAKASNSTGSIANPIVGRSMILACIVVTIFYLLLNFIFLYSIPAAEIIAAKERFVGAVAMAIGGEWCRRMMSWVIILSSLTSVLAMTMTGPYVYLQMFQDYSADRWVPNQRVQKIIAISIQTVLALLVVQFGTLRSTLAYLGLTLTACGALAIATLWFAGLRRRHLQDSVSIPLRWWEHVGAGVYVVGAGVLFAVASTMIPSQFYWCLATIAVGLALYAIIKKLSVRATAD
jgi:APA family basic amino acid/polyamine antiporter